MMTINDVNLIKNKKKPNISIVLEALYMGLTVKLKYGTYMLAELKDGNEGIINIVNEETGYIMGEGETMPINALIKMSNLLTEEEVSILSANIVLNQINKPNLFGN